jgi:Ca-activated chloride channel family protein
MRTFCTLAAALVLTAPAVHAQGWIEPRPMPVPFAESAITKLRTSVSVRLVDRIAHVEVEEWFRNDGRAPMGEGDYLYPLPGEAVFSEFSLYQGDQELKGETMDAATARGIYEEIVRRKKDPALIELVGHGLMRARVFPIQAGETRRITLRYTQVVPRAGDALHYRYAAGGRNPQVLAWTAGEAHGTPRPERADAPITFRLVADDGARFRDAFSPTHTLRSRRVDGRLEVTPEASLTGDLAVFLPLAGAPVGLTVATHRPSSEPGYFMLTLSPEQVEAARVPRDVTVVVDVSGSMSGEKLEQTRGALRQLLGTLDGADRLRLIAFGSGVSVWRSAWTPATREHLAEAGRWVEGLAANGGTNIAGALDEAFQATSPADRLPMVVFMTDGLPSVGEQNPERIAAAAEAARGRARVFAFGVGYDVNTLLLDGLGAAGRGSTQYVQPGQDVEQAIGLLATRIQLPVLTDLALADLPVQISEVYPTRLPDLFADEELVIFGRYEGSTTDGRISVTGRRSGRTERYATAAEFAEHSAEDDFIPRLWAARKLGELTRTIRLEGATPELIEEVRSTALRYGLLSEYTSYLVLEPEAVVALDGSVALQRGVAAAPPPAMAVSGAGAVASSEAARRSREARSLADVAAVQEDVAARNGADADGTRNLAGRTFTLREGVWEDASHTEEKRVVAVQAFSSAYFDLLGRLPELKPYWTALPALLVAGERVSIRVSAEGAERLGAAELDRLVAEFRTRR